MAEPHPAKNFHPEVTVQGAPVTGGQSFRALLGGAIDSSDAADHALLLLDLDESPRLDGEGVLLPGEAESLLPQLAEIVRGADMLARVASGRYGILLHDCSMAQMSRKIAAIDFLRAGYADAFHGAMRDTTPIGTTYLRPDDTSDRAICAPPRNSTASARIAPQASDR